MSYTVDVNFVRDAGDDVVLSVPLMIRMLEWAREDAPDDVSLHRAVEAMITLGGGPLDMVNYEKIVAK